jgi:hypothetical protein
MKVIFLDIDGVLNSSRWYKERKANGETRTSDAYEICPKHVAQFNRILRATGASVVLSSTWRKYHTLPEMIAILQSRGCELTHFIGRTPDGERRLESGLYQSVRRGTEIQQWLDENPGVSNFIIIDDDSDMEHLMPFLVHCDFIHGLTEKEADEAIRRLNSKPIARGLRRIRINEFPSRPDLREDHHHQTNP